MRYRPAHAAADGRRPSLFRIPRRARTALTVAFAAAIGLVPAVFVATAAQAAAGDVTIDSDIEQNEGDSFVFDVRRESGGASALTLDYEVVGGGVAGTDPAQPGEDFQPLTGSTTFAASRATLKRFTVAGISDAFDEHDESFTVKFMDPADHTSVIAYAYGILDDDDPTPTYNLSASPAAVTEGNSTVVTATLSAPSNLPITVPWATADDTAVATQDYETASGSLSFAPGDTTKTFTVRTTDDDRNEVSPEQFRVVGGNGTNVGKGPNSTINVQVNDNDDAPVLGVTNPSDTNEGGTATFTVTLSAPSDQTVTVHAATADGSAKAGTLLDYTAVSPDLTFSPGDTTKTVSVTTRSDSVDEDDPENFTLTLSSPFHATLNAQQTTATANIRDTDMPPVVSIDPTSVMEGSATHDATFDIHLDAASGRSVTVGYSLVGGSATAGTDYTAIPDGSVTFAPGDMVKHITVPILGDTTHEPDEQFDIVLSNVGGTVGGGTGAVPITITDDDNLPTLASLTSPAAMAEGNGAGQAVFTVALSNASSDPITVRAETADGTAHHGGMAPGGMDYDQYSGTLTFAPGETTKTFAVTVNGDTTFEGPESASVSVDLDAGEVHAAAGPPVTGTLTLTNDDAAPTVTLVSSSAFEGSSAVVMATVAGVAQDDITGTVTVTGASDGSSNPAESGDFATTSFTGTVPGGDQTHAPIQLGTIAFADDQADEPDETVDATWADPNHPGAQPSAFYTITDDPADMAPEVSVGDAAATEADGTLDAPITLDFGNAGNLATSTQRTFVVHYRTDNGPANGGAMAPGDFDAVTDGTVTFAPGDVSKNAPVTVKTDGLYELDETFGVTATSVAPSDAPILRAAGTETIHDSSASSRPSFSIDNVPMDENAAPTANFTVTLDQVSSQPVNFTVTARDGTAVSTVGAVGSHDYEAPAGTLQIPAGHLTGTIQVPVTPDSIYESDETAHIDVALAGGETGAVGGPVSGTLTIRNDDDAPTLTLAPAAPVAEGASLDVDATVAGMAQDDQHYSLALSGDSTNGRMPVDADDYTDSVAPATLPAGTTSGSTVTLRSVPILDDTADEADESLKVVVTDAGMHTVASQTYTVTDDPNDMPPTVSIGDATIDESDMHARPTVTLTFAQGNGATSTQRPITVAYSTEDVSATAGSDYTAPAAGATVRFDPGTTSLQLDIPVTDDPIYEPAETFHVKLGTITPNGVAAMGTDTGTVTIRESDTGAKPTWTLSADKTVAENVTGGHAVYTISMSDSSSIPVSFTVGMTNGGAVDGGSAPGSNDFDPPLTTYTIQAGQTSVDVPVTINDDMVYEQTEDATITVSPAAGQTGATGTSPQASHLTITDNDPKPTIILNQVTRGEGSTLSVDATQTGQAQASLTFDLMAAGDSSGGNDPAEGSDWTAGQMSGTIPAGSATGTVTTLGTIMLNNDSVDENTEALTVVATDHAGDLGSATSTYMIADDANDMPPAVSLGDVAVDETGAAASVPVTLTYLAGNGAASTERDTVLNYATTDETATAGSDYTGTAAGRVVIPAAMSSGTIDIPITDDSVYENAETFTVALLSHTPADATVSDGTALVTINRNDTDYRGSFSVVGVSRLEDATTPTDFTIRLDHAGTADVSFVASMVPGTATTGGNTAGSNDYTFANPGTVTIHAGETSASVPITINSDQVYEGTETATLHVALAPSENNITGDPKDGTLTITDDEAVPHLVLNTGGSGTEGTDITVTGHLDQVAQHDVTFGVLVEGDGSGSNVAATDADYVTTGSTVTVPGGTPTTTATTFRTIRLSNDKIDEPIETLKVTATDVAADLAAATGLYTINDDPNDMPPSISVGDTSVREGSGPADVPVTLAFDSATNDATSTTRPVTVNYTLTGGTATAISDFGATPTPVSIAAGVLLGDIMVPIVDDQRDEPDETFTVNVASATPTETRIADGAATVTIQDNDSTVPKPGFTVADVSQLEGNAAGTATFTVRLTSAAQDAVTFDVGIADGTAVDATGGVGGNDYNPPAATLTIPMGSLTGQITVPVNGDTVYEDDETATLTVGLATGERDATGDSQDATLTLRNDDALPTVQLTNQSGNEGDEIALAGTVTGSTQDDAPITIDFDGDDSGANMAADSTDYDTSGVTPVIPAGTTNGARIGLGSIALTNDTIDENTESFTGTTGGQTASYRIFDDPEDLPPTVSVSGRTIGEGGDSVDLTVSLNFPTGTTSAGYDITVPWSTADGTAKAGSDYVHEDTSTIIAAGDLSSTITVPITDDQLFEGNQTFSVNLGTPEPNAVKVGTGTGTVTIVDNDSATAPTLSTPPSVLQGATAVTLTGAAGEGATVQLYGVPAAGGAAVLLATTTAGTTGAYSITYTVRAGYNLYTRANGLTSPTRVVRVQQQPTLTGRSATKGTVTLTATGNPGTAGQTVSIQRRIGTTWSTVATGQLLSNGTYTVTLRGLISRGVYPFRVSIPSSPSVVGNVSPEVRFTIL